MSKPVRISDYLAEELEKIAAKENRSLANLVQHLLTQALTLDHSREAVGDGSGHALPPIRDQVAREDPHFKPDFK